MIRGLVTILVLPGLLLTQAALLNHAHCGHMPAGHGHAQHLHIQNQNHGGCSHHREAVPAEQKAEPQQDHDSDAVFFAASDAVPTEKPAALHASHDSIQWIDPVEDCQIPTHVRSFALRHPPPDPFSVCPIYLRHLALRI